MNGNAREFCNDHILRGCRTTCPLSQECKVQKYDSLEVFAKRVNTKADALVKEGK